MHRIFASLLLVPFCAISFFAPVAALAVTIPTVLVGNPGNAADTEVMTTDGTTGYGAVPYNYHIGTYEVTNAQYAEFLSAKAASDPLALYNAEMGSTGGITRSGSNGSYTYAVKTNMGNKPVNYVSWYDSIRFANWLHNGQSSGDTETGAYTVGSLDPDGTPTNGLSITRNAGATWFLTSEDEWYKAAYYDGSSYFDYPASSNAAPRARLPPGGVNSANFAFVVSALTDVGAYTLSYSPYGTFDQGGNVFEWNETMVSGSLPSLRGGSVGTSSDLLRASFRYVDNPTFEYFITGFRVANIPEGFIPEPSSGVLAIVGCGILLWWRKRFK